MRRDLFVYGSLAASEVYLAVTGVRRRGVPAVLRGQRAVRVLGQVYPMLRPAPGRELRGWLYRRLGAHELARLDAFEGAWYRRVRVAVRLGGTHVRAFVYRRAATAKVRSLDVDWDLAEFRQHHARAFARRFRDARRLASLRARSA